MTWRIEYEGGARKDLEKMDKPAARRIVSFLRERVLKQATPRAIGEALKGTRYGDLWKYRVGDYRVIVRILDLVLVVLVVRIGHRRDIYKQPR